MLNALAMYAASLVPRCSLILRQLFGRIMYHNAGEEPGNEGN